MKRKQKSASRRRGEILPIDSYSLMGDPNAPSQCLCRFIELHFPWTFPKAILS